MRYLDINNIFIIDVLLFSAESLITGVYFGVIKNTLAVQTELKRFII